MVRDDLAVVLGNVPPMKTPPDEPELARRRERALDFLAKVEGDSVDLDLEQGASPEEMARRIEKSKARLAASERLDLVIEEVLDDNAEVMAELAKR